jgi:ankyrin repeat protein
MKRNLIIAITGLMLLMLAGCTRLPTTALTIAAERGDAAKVRKLIAAGANVNEKDEAGYTALMWAARKGNMEIARALVEARADLNVRDCASAGWTPLMHAIHKNQNDLAHLLIERGADVNATAGDCREHQAEGGKTALAYAAANDNAEIVKALLVRGANPYGMHGADSALSYAVAGTLDIDHLMDGKCPTETVKALLERAPDLNLRGDIWNRKAIFIAKQKGCTEFVALLEKHGSMLGFNQGGSRLGSHLVKVSPACGTEEKSASDNGRHHFSCGNTTIVIDQERLTVNGQSYGALQPKRYGGGRRRQGLVNFTERPAVAAVASN